MMSAARKGALAGYENLIKFLAGTREKRVPSLRSTYVRKLDNGNIEVCYHDTPVVTLHPDGVCVLRSGGNRTVSTKARINEFVGKGTVWQKKRVWVTSAGEFYDGIEVRR